jgi:hypothetical protein
LRARVIGDRLFVPDGDPPGGEPGFIYQTKDGVRFTEIRLEQVFHTYDLTLYKGGLFASNCMIRRSGSLHSPTDADLASWRPAFITRSSRLRFATVFLDHLYVATEPDGSGRDFLRWPGSPLEVAPEELDAVPGDAVTFRWFVSSENILFWSMRDGREIRFLSSRDGEHWQDGPGFRRQFVSDLAELDGNLYVLTNRGLWGSTDHRRFEQVAKAPGGRSFGVVLVPKNGESTGGLAGNSDGMGSLTAFRGQLWAGSSNGGVLYRIE